MGEVNYEPRAKKRKEEGGKTRSHFRRSDEMHSSLIECLTCISYKVSCEFTNTDLYSMETFLKYKYNETKSKAYSIKMVCLYFGGFISIYLQTILQPFCALLLLKV